MFANIFIKISLVTTDLVISKLSITITTIDNVYSRF